MCCPLKKELAGCDLMFCYRCLVEEWFIYSTNIMTSIEAAVKVGGKNSFMFLFCFLINIHFSLVAQTKTVRLVTLC